MAQDIEIPIKGENLEQFNDHIIESIFKEDRDDNTLVVIEVANKDKSFYFH